jgi:hypothetical protein
MPEPNEYQILLNLQQALQQIAVSGGYYFDVDPAAVRLDVNVDDEALAGAGRLRPFIVLEPQPESWEYSPAKQLLLVMPVLIHWVGDAAESSDPVRLQTFFRGCADVERAIAVDVQRGGLAADTRITERTLDATTDGSTVWARVKTEMRIHRAFGQP